MITGLIIFGSMVVIALLIPIGFEIITFVNGYKKIPKKRR